MGWSSTSHPAIWMSDVILSKITSGQHNLVSATILGGVHGVISPGNQGIGCITRDVLSNTR
jgi:hypothetical protein